MADPCFSSTGEPQFCPGTCEPKLGNAGHPCESDGDFQLPILTIGAPTKELGFAVGAFLPATVSVDISNLIRDGWTGGVGVWLGGIGGPGSVSATELSDTGFGTSRTKTFRLASAGAYLAVANASLSKPGFSNCVLRSWIRFDAGYGQTRQLSTGQGFYSDQPGENEAAEAWARSLLPSSVAISGAFTADACTTHPDGLHSCTTAFINHDGSAALTAPHDGFGNYDLRTDNELCNAGFFSSGYIYDRATANLQVRAGGARIDFSRAVHQTSLRNSDGQVLGGSSTGLTRTDAGVYVLPGEAFIYDNPDSFRANNDAVSDCSSATSDNDSWYKWIKLQT